jgi:hypothetical protein
MQEIFDEMKETEEDIKTTTMNVSVQLESSTVQKQRLRIIKENNNKRVRSQYSDAPTEIQIQGEKIAEAR